MIRDADGRIIRIRYVLPRHKAANWVGRGHGRKSTRPGANGVVELSPFEFLDRLADLVPPPRKHRHRYHRLFPPNHKPFLAFALLATSGCCGLPVVGEPLEPPPMSPARGPPTDWGELVQVHDDRHVFQATDRRAARNRHQQPLSGTGRKPPKPRERQTGTRSAPTHENHRRRGYAVFWRTAAGRPTRPISLLKDSPSAGRSLRKCH